MNKKPLSSGRLRRLNRRQRKKRRLGEFQELVFAIRVRFRQPLDEVAWDRFLEAFLAFIESRQLAVGGLGGRLPLAETDGIISAWGRGSPADEDRQAILAWLHGHPEVALAEAGEFVDGWYGWD